MNLPLLHAFLKQHRHGVLSSISPEGSSQSALMGIAITPALEIIFDTLGSSRKYRNLIAQPACSLVVGWGGEQTVQYEGQAILLEESDRLSYIEAYFATWPECRAHVTWPGIVYFVVRPQWVRYSDWGLNPPLIQEFSSFSEFSTSPQQL